MNMTISKSELARRARLDKITGRSNGKVITAAELLRRHGLPDTMEAIERGEKGPKRQQTLDLPPPPLGPLTALIDFVPDSDHRLGRHSKQAKTGKKWPQADASNRAQPTRSGARMSAWFRFRFARTSVDGGHLSQTPRCESGRCAGRVRTSANR